MLRKIIGSQLRINMFSGVAITLVNVVITGISYPVYLHFLGYEKYGVWIVLYTIINFVQLSNLGIGPAVMKLVAEEYGRQNIQAVQKYIATAMVVLVGSGILALVVMLCFKSQIINAFKLDSENARIVEWLLPYVGLLSIYVFVVQTCSATLSGLGRMDLANYSEGFGRVIALTISILMLFSGFGIVSLLVGNAVSYVFVHVTTYYLIRRLKRFHFLSIDNLNFTYLKKLLYFGSGMFGGSLISVLLGPFNKLMISRYVGVSFVSVYEIAYNSCMQLRNLFESSFRAISPEISRITCSGLAGKNEQINNINRYSNKVIWLLGLPVWIVLLVFITPLLNLWLGHGFIYTLPLTFQIMLLGMFFSLLGVPAFYILLGLGKTRKLFYSFLIQSLVNSLFILIIVLLGYKLSVFKVALAVLFGMLSSTLFLLGQKRLLMREGTIESSVKPQITL